MLLRVLKGLRVVVLWCLGLMVFGVIMAVGTMWGPLIMLAGYIIIRVYVAICDRGKTPPPRRSSSSSNPNAVDPNDLMGDYPTDGD